MAFIRPELMSVIKRCELRQEGLFILVTLRFLGAALWIDLTRRPCRLTIRA